MEIDVTQENISPILLSMPICCNLSEESDFFYKKIDVKYDHSNYTLNSIVRNVEQSNIICQIIKIFFKKYLSGFKLFIKL